MGRPKGSFSKNKFDALADEFKDAVAGLTVDEIKKRISETAILEVTEKQILKQDPEVLGAKEALKNLMEPYRESLKEMRTKIEYCKRVLDDKGAAPGSR